MAGTLSRGTLVRNANYQRNGLKSYVHALKKFGIGPTVDGPYCRVNQVQQQGGVNIPQNAPNVSADQARAVAEGASRGFWWFFFGSLLGLIASLIGAATGARSPRINHS